MALWPYDRHDARDLGPEPVPRGLNDGNFWQHHRRSFRSAGQFRNRAVSDERLHAIRDRRRDRRAWRSSRNPALHPARADRARNHAERKYGGGARRQSEPGLFDHLRRRRSPRWPCGRNHRACVRRIPDDRRGLCRQIFHHRDRRRRVDRDRHDDGVDAVRRGQPDRDLRDDAGLRRGRAARGRDRADPRAASGDNRPILSGKPLNARALNVLGLALVAVVGIAVLFLTPRLFDLDVLLNITVYMIMAVLALSLALIWGFGGILCFGQSAFFGLGAYTYAIAMINIGESTAPLILAILIPAAFAALLGYFMFYGRISDVYLGVITLTLTLILFNSINSTAGPEFHIGSAKLGGFNGIPGIPSLNVPFFKDRQIDLEGMFYLSTTSLLLTYFGLRAFLASYFGRTIVGIRENEQRAQLLGYDPRIYKLATFTIGAALAGYAGCLFANWGNFVSPTIFGLAQSAQIIIWVIVGGRGTLIGPILGCVGIQWLTAALGANAPSGDAGWQALLGNVPLILGAILIAFVLVVPKGLVPTIGGLDALFMRARAGASR